ncbi:MAG TPA: EAL domain-containing protein [Burkholderiales bacterium]|nr:EAL domain-containing protein [Burkholderiales bacterium]
MSANASSYSLEFIQDMLSEESGRTSAWFNDLELRSVFQPAFSLSHRRAVGFKAAIRSFSSRGNPVAHQELFGPVHNFAETSMLDMLCTTLHVRNYAQHRPANALLLLNLHPEVVVDSAATAAYLGRLIASSGLRPDELMIDIPGPVLGHPRLKEAVTAYRGLGCLIAVADFGLDSADLDNIWQLSPTVVKIGRPVIARAVHDSYVREALPSAVSLLHEMGSLALVEGIESQDEALAAVHADADFASGYFFGPLHDTLRGYGGGTAIIDELWAAYRDMRPPARADTLSAGMSFGNQPLYSKHIRKLRHASPAEIARYREERRPFVNELQRLGARVEGGEAFSSCCSAFLHLDGAIRCYLLGDDGLMLEPAVMAPQPPARDAVDFDSLAGDGGNWMRRDFFRRATREPEVVQVTRQYCSLIGYPRCVTFSIAVRVKGRLVIVCGDVDWTLHAMVRRAPAAA